MVSKWYHSGSLSGALCPHQSSSASVLPRPEDVVGPIQNNRSELPYSLSIPNLYRVDTCFSLLWARGKKEKKKKEIKPPPPPFIAPRDNKYSSSPIRPGSEFNSICSL